MKAFKSFIKPIGIVIAIPFLAGYEPSTATPNASAQSALLRFIQTVQVTPTDDFLTGDFVRIGYVPATDRFVVPFMTHIAHPIGTCTDGAHAYIEYTLDMQPTGRSGVLNCSYGDGANLLVDNILYDANMLGSTGWGLQRFDATTFEMLSDITYSVNAPQEGTGDMMLAFVNGRLDVSGGYNEAGGPPPIDEGAGSHHNFFTPDLQFIEKRILTDTPHRSEGAMVFVDGIYHYVASTSYTGDMLVMQYGADWKYLGSKVLINQVHFPTGIAFDEQRFYVAYLNTSQRNGTAFFPCYPNVHLAAFDRGWNLLDDVAVTGYVPSENMKPSKPWVILHGNRLYIAYDINPVISGTGEDLLDQIEAYVSIYELVPSFVDEQPESPPTHYQLEQNYPNPFNSVTHIGFSLPNRVAVTLKLYDILGREVVTLFDGFKESGRYTLPFRPKDLQSGVYFYKLQTGSFVGTRKLCLLR